MVRIVQEQVEEKPPVTLDKHSKALFQLLGVVIADQPEQLSKLLKNYGIVLSGEFNHLRLADAVIFAMSKKDHQFNYDLSQLLAGQRIPEDHDSFVPDALIRYAAPQKTITKPSAEQIISASINKTFQKGLTADELKGLKEKAKKESIKSMVKYQTEAALLSEKQAEAEEEPSDKESSSALKIVGIMGVMGVVAIVGSIMIWSYNKKPIPMPSTA